MLNLEANFRDIFGVDALPVLDELMLDSYEQAEDPRPMLFQMNSSDREISQRSSITSLGVFTQVGEAELAPKDDFHQSYNRTHTQLKYAKSIGISEEMIADARFDLISRMVKSLGRSARDTQLISAMNVFNNAFGTQTSWDAVALVSASHPSEVGNQSNTQGAVDLSYSALQDAETTFRKTQDQRGKRLYIKPKYLLVAEEGRHEAIEIVKSPYKADSANNNINSTGMDGGLIVVSSPYLTDADAWFLLSDPMDHGLEVIDRQPLSQKLHEDVLAGVLYYKASYRQAIGVNDWRGVVGASGA